jgi:hypothetical protein
MQSWHMESTVWPFVWVVALSCMCRSYCSCCNRSTPSYTRPGAESYLNDFIKLNSSTHTMNKPLVVIDRHAETYRQPRV